MRFAENGLINSAYVSNDLVKRTSDVLYDLIMASMPRSPNPMPKHLASPPPNMDEARFKGVRFIPFHPGHADVDHLSDHHVLAVNYSTLSTQTAIASDRLRRRTPDAGSMLWLPAGVDFRQRGSTNDAGLLVFIEETFADLIADENGGRTPTQWAPVFWHDARGAAIGRRLLDLLWHPQAEEMQLEETALDLLSCAIPKSGGRAPHRLSAEDRRVRRAMDFVRDQISAPLTLAEIAAEVGLSPVQLGRLFQANVGQSVWAWTSRMRCRAARRLLLSTQKPLAEIAYECGFCDQAHMTKMLVRLLGATPGAIRASQGARTA